VDAFSFWLITHWSGNGTDWDDRHQVALIIGMLSFFIIFITFRDFAEGFSGSSIVAAITAWMLWKLWLRTQARTSAVPQ
jgi:hypothetical protein